MSYSLLSSLVKHFLPELGPNRIEHQIIKYYLITILSISLCIAVHKLIQRFSTKPPSLLISNLHHQRSIVDIFIDFNHFHPNVTHHSISFLLLQFKSIVHQSLKNSSFPDPESLRLVYWSYIDRNRPELADWINQLDNLESHFQHGFVQVIDTSHQTCDRPAAQKPLLNDLIKILNVSPPGRLYVISTSDPQLYGAGTRLIKNHPKSPILAYIPPHGSSVESNESNANVDYLFSWEKDETVRLVKEFSTSGPKSDSSPTRLARALQEFEPFNLIIQAYSQSELPLETLKDYIKPWFSESDQSGTDLDEQVLDYIDSAIVNEVISISEQSALDKHNPEHWVVHPGKASHHSSNKCALDEAAIPLIPADKSALEDDSLTTTGSNTSSRSRSAPPSPLKTPIKLSKHLPDHHQSQVPLSRGTTEQDPITSSPSGNTLKHKHRSLDLTEIISRPIKKNRKQEGSIRSVSASTMRSGSNSLLMKKKSLNNKSKNSQIKSVVQRSSTSINSDQSGWLVERKRQNQLEFLHQVQTIGQAPIETSVFCDGNLHDGLSLQKPEEENNVSKTEEGIERSEKRMRSFSTVWLNCSSGMMVNYSFILTRSKKNEYQSLNNLEIESDNQLEIKDENEEERVVHCFNFMNLKDDDDLNLNQIYHHHHQSESSSLSLNQEANYTRQEIYSSHLHFKSLFIPALLNLHSSSSKVPSSPRIFNFNVRLQLNHPIHTRSFISHLDLNQVD